MEFIGSINPLSYLEPNLINPAAPQTPEELAHEFEKVFFMQLAKQAFKNSFWGKDSRPETKIYQDLFEENFAEKLAADNPFGLREMIEKRIMNSAKFKKPAL